MIWSNNVELTENGQLKSLKSVADEAYSWSNGAVLKIDNPYEFEITVSIPFDEAKVIFGITNASLGNPRESEGSDFSDYFRASSPAQGCVQLIDGCARNTVTKTFSYARLN